LIVDAHGQGVLFVGAAGNQPVTTPSYPAAYPEVLATTAGDRSGRIASYANRGEFVDVIAPGTGLVHLGNQTFVGSGTSYSAAYVTGIAAGLGESGKTAAQIELEIRSRLSPPAAKP
jgi:thermitase